MSGRRGVLKGLVAAAFVTPARAWAADARTGLIVEPIDVARGEDGAGTTRDADAPHALLLLADGGWPARALDPVLRIGRLHFHDYVHLDRRTLRFVVDDVVRLRVGDEVWVQYGDDAESRVDLGALEKTW